MLVVGGTPGSGSHAKAWMCPAAARPPLQSLSHDCVRGDLRDRPPQAGIAVFELGPDGLLPAVEVWDDVEPPGVQSSAQPKRPTAIP